jgi:hypothetical protein
MRNRYSMFAEPLHVGLLKRLRLLRPAERFEARRRIVLVVLAGWAPMALLASIEALFSEHAAPLAFFGDFAMYAQLLIAAPILILCEYTVLPALGDIGLYFSRSAMIPDEDHARFDALVESTRRLSAGVWPSFALVIVVYAINLAIFLFLPHLMMPDWQRSADRAHFSLAGWWHMLVSLPIVIGLLFAWLWRLAIWTRFLYVASRMPLRLVASHPDRVAGLQFVAYSPRVFVPLAFAISVIGAGTFANEVFHQGVAPLEHSIAPVVTVLLLVAILLLPPLFFSPALLRTWQLGVFLYGDLARRVGQRFEAKWLADGRTIDEETLGVPDFSTTTDLYGVVGNVYAMRIVLFDLRVVAGLAVAACLPFVPIWLSAIPARTVLDHLIGLLI